MLRYFGEIDRGSLRAENGQKYSFGKEDWIDVNTAPIDGTAVVFEMDATRAVRIRVDYTC